MPLETCAICQKEFKRGEVKLLNNGPTVHFDCWRAKFFAEYKLRKKREREPIVESEHVFEEIDLKNRSADNEYT